MVSITIHTVLIALLLLVSKQVVTPFSEMRPSANVSALISLFIRKHAALSIGGGHQPLPAAAGYLPKIAPQFEISIEAPPDAFLPAPNLPGLGNPLGKFTNGSAGTGGLLGIGDGHGTGAGDNTIGTVYRGGNGVTLPVLIRRVDPEFSEEARKARHSGIVILHADVDSTGRARNIRVVQSLGMGLDEKAVAAVSQWLFKPGTKDGKAVAVSANIEVRFQLL